MEAAWGKLEIKAKAKVTLVSNFPQAASIY